MRTFVQKNVYFVFSWTFFVAYQAFIAYPYQATNSVNVIPNHSGWFIGLLEYNPQVFIIYYY